MHRRSLICAFATLVFFQPGSGNAQLPPLPLKPAGGVSVTANPVTPAKIVDAVTSHDTRVQIVAETSAVIGAPMTGQLVYFPLRDGDKFEKDAVIARFDCAEQNGALAHAKAVLNGKEAASSSSRKLNKLGTSSELEYQTAQSAASEAKADYDIAEAAVSHCEITAPFAGRVASTAVRSQQFVQMGSPLVEILSDVSLELQMILPSSWLSWVKPGTKFDIVVDETRHTYHAEITRLSGKVDAASQSIKAYGKLTAPAPDLLPGMSGRTLLTPPAQENK